jgi:chromosomal replication initiation ATPase DnaA
MSACHPQMADMPKRRRNRRTTAALAVQDRDIMGPRELRDLLDQIVAGGFDIDEPDLRRASRGQARIALARQVAMYPAHVACSLTKTEVGRLFERDRTTAHHACLVIEQRRDDHDFDDAIDHLERIIRIVIGTRRPQC